MIGTYHCMSKYKEKLDLKSKSCTSGYFFTGKFKYFPGGKCFLRRNYDQCILHTRTKEIVKRSMISEDHNVSGENFIVDVINDK